MCKVNVSTTLEEQSIYVEDSGDSNVLLHAVEGEDPVKVARLAWDGYISTHRADSVHLQLQADLPARRLGQVVHAVIWLLWQIVHERAAPHIL